MLFGKIIKIYDCACHLYIYIHIYTNVCAKREGGRAGFPLLIHSPVPFIINTFNR